MPTNSKSPASLRRQPVCLAGLPRGLASRLRRVELLLCDVDGVLTDGLIMVGVNTESKNFHIQDGLGLSVLRKSGVRVGWISNRPSAATARRAKELKIDFLKQERRAKVAVIGDLLVQLKLDWEQVCYVGDDIVDLGPLKRAGVSIAVANAVAEVMAQADFITRARGGNGAVREVCELILKAQDLWPGILASYLE